jgi:flavodoxin
MQRRATVTVLVLYQSRKGHTRGAAEAIAQVARDLTYEVVVKSVIEVRKADVDAADVLFVGTWVHGLILFGIRPAGADLWVPALPSLEGKPIGVFCTYAFNPRYSLRTLGDMLAARGATILGQHAFHRSNPQDGAQAFVETVLQSAERVLA